MKLKSKFKSKFKTKIWRAERRLKDLVDSFNWDPYLPFLEKTVSQQREFLIQTLLLTRGVLPNYLVPKWVGILLWDTLTHARLLKEAREHFAVHDWVRPKFTVDLTQCEKEAEKVEAGTHKWVFTHDPADPDRRLRFIAVPYAKDFDPSKGSEVTYTWDKTWEIRNPQRHGSSPYSSAGSAAEGRP